MPHKKKRLFTNKNSVKYLLLPGKAGATNADGEILQNVLVPVAKNYKTGSSLLISNVDVLCQDSTVDKIPKEPDLQKIIKSFSDFDLCHEDSKNLESKRKNKSISTQQNRSVHTHKVDSNIDEQFQDDESDYSDSGSQFSTADSDFEDLGATYVLTCAKSDCPDNVKTFNARFERVLEEYEDIQIGALDDEEIGGLLSTESERVTDFLGPSSKKEDEYIELGSYDESIKEKILCYVEDEKEEKYIKISTEKPLEYDCESILSTYSNIYNHPAVISAEHRVKKIRIPDNPLKKRLTKGQLKKLDEESNEEDSEEESDDNESTTTNCNIRHKGETPEQRRERKNLFKEAKRESRVLKKENKIAFKNEKKLQKAQALNTHRNAGIKLL